MARVIEEGKSFRLWSNGRLQVSEAVLGAVLAGDFEGDDEEDDSLEGDDDDSVEGEEGDDNELGAEKKKKKKKGLLASIFGNKKKEPKANSNKTTTLNVTGMPHQMATKKSPYKPAFLSGSATSSAAEIVEITIRPQEDFHASSIHFDGSLAASGVVEIKFGAKTVYSGPGIDVDIFKAANPLGDLLKNTSIKAGLDILIRMQMPGAGTAKVFMRGLSPRNDDQC